MKTIFVADSHLKGLGDPCQSSVVEFLDGLSGVDALVILGDFFENWPGENRVALNEYAPVLSALGRLRQRGVKLVYVEGNHDFSMGPFFTRTLEATVCEEVYEAQMDGKRIIAVHGDTVEMTLLYRLWRALLRSWLGRLIMRAMGPDFAWSLGLRLSNKSRSYSGRGSAVDDALKRFAGERLKAGFDAVVSAHSHRAGVCELGTGVYANPGSLRDSLSHLVFEDGLFRVVRGAKPS